MMKNRKKILWTGILFGIISLTNQIHAKPVIGINTDSGSTNPLVQRNIQLSLYYVDAITSAGGIPVLIPPVRNDPDALAKYMELCDGFLFTGGADIDPKYYKEEPHPTHKQLSYRRQEFDFELMKKVLESRKPVMGICLGCQQLNVITGGSLIQDIPSLTSSTITHRQNLHKDETVHDVEITSGSRLADIISTTSLHVNSYHHQAVRDTATTVSVAAKSSDGIVEAIELQNYPFGIGIQWHPEGLTKQTEHLALFKALVEKAEEARTKSAR